MPAVQAVSTVRARDRKGEDLMSTHRFRVTITANATRAEMLDYVQSALRGWGGQHRPEDPFFGTNKEIEVVNARERGKTESSTS